MTIDWIKNSLTSIIESNKFDDNEINSRLQQTILAQKIGNFFDENKEKLLALLNNDQKRIKIIKKSLKYINSNEILNENVKAYAVQSFYKSLFSCQHLSSIQGIDGKIFFFEKCHLDKLLALLNRSSCEFQNTITPPIIKLDYLSDLIISLIKFVRHPEKRNKILTDASLKEFLLQRSVNMILHQINDTVKKLGISLKYFFQYEEDGEKSDSVDAVQLYEEAAIKGNVTAQYYLGFCLQHGICVKKSDLIASVKWFRLAAAQEMAAAQHALGYDLKFGIGVDKPDVFAGVAMFRAAALQGYAPAQYSLASSLHSGRGVQEVDHFEATVWLKKAAEQGLVVAQNELGYCLQHGIGVKKNLTEALEWYEKAILQGDVRAKKKAELCKKAINQLSKESKKNIKNATSLPKKNIPLFTSSTLTEDSLRDGNLAKKISIDANNNSNNAIPSNDSIDFIKPKIVKNNSDRNVNINVVNMEKVSRIVEPKKSAVSAPLLLSPPIINMNKELTEEHKRQWNDSFSSLQQQYRGLEISWNQVDCTLHFSEEKNWLIRGGEKKIITFEVTPNPKNKKIFFQRMKRCLKKENIVSTLQSLSLNIMCLGKTPLSTDWKDFNKEVFDSISSSLLIVNQTLISTKQEPQECSKSISKQKNAFQHKEIIQPNQAPNSQKIEPAEIIKLICDITNVFTTKNNGIINSLQCVCVKKNKFRVSYADDGRFSLSTHQGFINITNLFNCVASTLNQYVGKENFVTITGVNSTYRLNFHFQTYLLKDLQANMENLQTLFQEQTKNVKGGIFLPPLPLEDCKSLLLKKSDLEEKKSRAKKTERQPCLVGCNTPVSPLAFANGQHQINFQCHLEALADNPGDVAIKNKPIHHFSYLLHIIRLFDLLSHNFQDKESRIAFKNIRNTIRHFSLEYQTIYDMVNPFVLACRTGTVKNITVEIAQFQKKLENVKKQSFQSVEIWDKQIKELQDLTHKIDETLEIKRRDALLFCCSISGKFKNDSHKYRILYQKLGHTGFTISYPELRNKLWELYIDKKVLE